jgi:transcriptional regulator with XRE-family HTH domain
MTKAKQVKALIASGRGRAPAGAGGTHGSPPSHQHALPKGKTDGQVERRVGPPPAIGPKLKQFRLRENLTLHDVQAMTGMSNSMLSQIERGVVNPTFARVWHLTQSLGIGVSDLLGEVSSSLEDANTYEHLNVNRTPVMTSADGKSVTRILSPLHQSLPVEWYEMVFKPGGSLRANAHGNGAWEHQTCIEGTLVIEFGDHEIVLNAGETVRYSAEQPHGARNDTDKLARVLLVVISRKELSAMGF